MDKKQCDKCGSMADVEQQPHFHGVVPRGWGHVQVQRQTFVNVPARPQFSLMRDVVEGEEEPEGTFEQPIAASTSVDLCPDCLNALIDASGCADRIRAGLEVVDAYPAPPFLAPRRRPVAPRKH